MKSLANKQLYPIFSKNALFSKDDSEMDSHPIKCNNPYWDEIALRPDYHLLPNIQPHPSSEVHPFITSGSLC